MAPVAVPDGLWNGQARQWSRIGSPLRPCAEDVALLQEPLRRLGPLPAGLLLGVTPELLSLSPVMTAVDNNPEMIASAWSPISDRQKVLLGDWRRLNILLPPASADFAAGDGSFNAVPMADHATLFVQLAQVLRPGGLLALRLFAAPEQPESAQDVIAAAFAGQIGSFHALKWRLAHTLAKAGNGDVPVAAIRDLFQRHVPNRPALATAAGWPIEQIDTIDVYAGSATVYSFPTLPQLQAVRPAGWQEVSAVTAGYELAERCPILTFRWNG